MSPYGVISVIRFDTITDFGELPMMNWENLIRCSNYYGLPPEEQTLDGALGYMATAVQKDLKPAATFRSDIRDPVVQKMIRTCPANCLIMPYVEENTTFICHDFKLSDLYNLAEINKRYDCYGISNIDWTLIEHYMEKDLAYFADSRTSGLTIERGAENDTQKVIIGLLLGYPIESTVASINHTDKVFSSTHPSIVSEHFKTNDEPFSDGRRKWIKIDARIIFDGQQESLYY